MTRAVFKAAFAAEEAAFSFFYGYKVREMEQHMFSFRIPVEVAFSRSPLYSLD